MSFAVRFRRALPAGTCVGVSLPQTDVFALPPGVHPDEAALVHASTAARRATFIGGRVATRTALAALGARADEAARPILSTPRGAPALPPGFVASISHKRDIAVAIAARAEPTPRTTIGIDVEIPRSLRADIAPRVLTPAERTEIAGLDPRAREAEIGTAPDGGRTARLALARDDGPFTVELHDASDDGFILVVATVTPVKRNDGGIAQL